VSLYLKALARQMDGPPRYAWLITETWTSDDENEDRRVPDVKFDRNGQTGPGEAPQELLDRLAAGDGRQWRTLMDEEVVHVGRYLHLDDGDDLGGDAFGPLEDWSKGDVGADEIQYLGPDGEWKSL
jgi:hypothetical protein